MTEHKTQLSTAWDTSEKALDALHQRTHQMFPGLPELSAQKQAVGQDDDEEMICVDVQKLHRITSKRGPSGLPLPVVDYSQFARQTFEEHGVFTQARTTKGRDRAKELYSEVQRDSINFGVSPETMKLFHRRQASDASGASTIRAEDMIMDHQDDDSTDGSSTTSLIELYTDARKTMKLASPQLVPERRRQLSEQEGTPRVAPAIPVYRRECHSVEESLLADVESGDFTFPKRRRSYYAKPLESFTFERPLSRNSTARSSTRSSVSCFATPATPLERRSSSVSVSPPPVSPVSPLKNKRRVSSLSFSPSRHSRATSLFNRIAED